LVFVRREVHHVGAAPSSFASSLRTCTRHLSSNGNRSPVSAVTHAGTSLSPQQSMSSRSSMSWGQVRLRLCFLAPMFRERVPFIKKITPRAPTEPKTRGSRLGSLILLDYSTTILTMGLPAALGDVGVVVGAPVAVAVGARTDGLAVRETVLSFILVMTRRSPKVQPGVPAAGVEGVDHPARPPRQCASSRRCAQRRCCPATAAASLPAAAPARR
jgi:hypothetical protein